MLETLIFFSGLTRFIRTNNELEFCLLNVYLMAEHRENLIQRLSPQRGQNENPTSFPDGERI